VEKRSGAIEAEETSKALCPWWRRDPGHTGGPVHLHWGGT